MKDKGLSEYITFSGNLQAGRKNTNINFRARIDNSGEVELDFDSIVLTDQTSFIMKHVNGEGDSPVYFALSGKAEDGTELKTEELYFNSVKHETINDDYMMTPSGSCLQAVVSRKLAQTCATPILIMRLKGFQNFRLLSAECRLGSVSMDGSSTIQDPDNITGYIEVRAHSKPDDLKAWHEEADKLLNHIRRVMSFATATTLQRPIVESFSNDKLELIAWSQSQQTSSPIPVFHFQNHESIFGASVESFFNPPFAVNNLYFAIEWFAMDSSYNEVRLVNAMTALENLVASNLDENFTGNNDALFMSKGEFDKTRKVLRRVIRQCIEKWSADKTRTADEITLELNERLADLNRRSILKKLKSLAERWSVPLDGISEDKIKAAKQARDRIVHRGHYYDDDEERNNDLSGHVTIVREIVVRFLLTVIGYQGTYISYINGYHFAQFPPQRTNG